MPFELDTSELFAGQQPVDPTDTDAESEAGSLEVDPPSGGDGGGESPVASDPADPPSGRKTQVPLGALQEERQRRQDLAADLQRERENAQRMQDRFNQLLASTQPVQQQEQEIQIPAFVDDPEGHVAGIKAQFERELQQLRQHAQGQNQQAQQQSFQQQLMAEVVAKENAYKQAVPDYSQAAEYAVQRKMAEYQAIGLDAATAQQALARDMMGLAAHAKQTNQDPAALFYNMAKAMGWSNNGGNGAPAAMKPPVQANTSLGSLPGASTPEDTGKLTAEKVGNMSDAEFEKLCKDMRRSSGSNPRPRT